MREVRARAANARVLLRWEVPETCPLDVAEILALDAEYRAAAARGELPKIAPKRENPSGAAWLPIMHRRVGGGSATLLFSNTPLAHRLGKTDDWVVIYYRQPGRSRSSQCTVVTEWHEGPLQGRRVVRGRERECLAYYESRARAA